MKVLQLVPALNYGDAIGNYVLTLMDIIRSMGYKTEVFAGYIAPQIKRHNIHQYENMPSVSQDDVLIYHMATGTKLNTLIDLFSCYKVMIYHNITPPKYFLNYDKFSTIGTREGIEQTKNLYNTFDYCLAVSEFNKEDLIRYGYSCPIDVMPIIIPFKNYAQKPAGHILRRYNDGIVNFLFVGRVVPNKKLEDVITVFYHYQTKYNSRSRLFFVGATGQMQLYRDRLQNYIQTLGCKNVIFTERVKFNEILSYYKIADVFLCMSDHEGFCVPLVEAMYFDIPIIAYDTSAISFTLGRSGILLKEKDPIFAAGVADALLKKPGFRETVLAGQRERLKDYDYNKLKSLFVSYFSNFLEKRFAP
jgi:glycosyltransferase involved in cell wall biosynthesis